MIVLVLNCGSSSVKFRVFDVDDDKSELLARGAVDRIGLSDSAISLETTGKQPIERTGTVENHQDALSVILEELLIDSEHGCISSLSEIQAVGHRVVHGGEKFSKASIIDNEVKSAIDECSKFAPLHNPPNLNGIWACERVLSDIPQVAVFDTAFHSSLPKEAYMYALPKELYEKQGIRRYGFHGTSHSYVAQEAEKLLEAEQKGEPPYCIVTCHLGSGASVAAVSGGSCVDTSMGFTPLEGLVMGTRCGDIDPAIVIYLMREYGAAQLDRLFNKESGLLGLTGYSDMRDVIALADGEIADSSSQAREMAEVTMRIYARRIKKYIGSYAAVLGGLDAVVFTAGIGEQSARLRALILDNMDVLGLILDEDANNRNDSVISTPESSAMALVIPTNEELVIAREAYQAVNAAN